MSQASNYHWGEFEAATVRLEHSETPTLLKAVQLSVPPLEGEHASKYALFINLFWQLLVPEGTSAQSRIEASGRAVANTGRYEERIDDIAVAVTFVGKQLVFRAEVV